MGERRGGREGRARRPGASARGTHRVSQSGSHTRAWGMRARGVSERQRPPSKRSQRRPLCSQQGRTSAQAKRTPPPCTANRKTNATAGERPRPTHLDDLTRLIVHNGGPLLVPQHRHGEAAAIVRRRLAVQLGHVVKTKEGLRLAPAAVVARLARRVHKVPAVLAHVRVHDHGGDGRLEALERPRNERPVRPRTRHGHVPNEVDTDGWGGGRKEAGGRKTGRRRETDASKQGEQRKKTKQRGRGGTPTRERGGQRGAPPTCVSVPGHHLTHRRHHRQGDQGRPQQA